MSAAESIFQKSNRRIATLALVVLALDQLSKWLVLKTLPEFQEKIIISGFFKFVHWGNTGAAWSLFSGRSPALAVFAVATLAAIFLWRRALGLRATSTQVCFGLLCGGILGNLVDRLVRHHVVDFIDLYFGSYHYPTFNVADSGICVGVILYLIFSFRSPDS